MGKAYLSPQLQNAVPQSFHRFAQAVGPHMRLGLPKDFFRRACRRQLLQHIPAPGIPNPGIQLAVGKSPCTSFTELHVGIGKKDPCPAEPFHILPAPVHVTAPFQQKRRPTCAGQHQRRKQTRRARSHHHRAAGRPARRAGRKIRRLRHADRHAPGPL